MKRSYLILTLALAAPFAARPAAADQTVTISVPVTLTTIPSVATAYRVHCMMTKTNGVPIKSTDTYTMPSPVSANVSTTVAVPVKVSDLDAPDVKGYTCGLILMSANGTMSDTDVAKITKAGTKPTLSVSGTF